MQNPNRHSHRLLRLRLGLFSLLLAGQVQAQLSTNYWDVNGATPGAGFPADGTWENASCTTDPTGSIDTANWVEGSVAYFSAGADAANTYVVTANSDHTVAGIQLQTPHVGAVIVNGPGRLFLPDGPQIFRGGLDQEPLTINAELAGTGSVLIPGDAFVHLGGVNTFSGGCGIYGGLTYFNNSSSFGTGTITNLAGGFAALLPYGGAPITLPNNFEISLAGDGFNFAPPGWALTGNNTPVTCTGTWDLQQTLHLRNSSDSTSPLTLSGVISGAPGMGLGISGNNSVNGGGMITLSGANTFDGPVSIGDGGAGATLVVSSFNSVGSPQPSSNLGRPTTVANGTIAIGFNSTTNTLIYVGPGETTDRVIDFAGTARGPWLEADGTGPIVFTSDFTASGSGQNANTKNLMLQGTNIANNEIRGKIVDHGVDGGKNFQTSVVKLGTGTWMLSGPNTYTAGTTISAGTLKIGADNTLPYGTGAGNTTINSGGILDLNGHNCTINNFGTSAGNVDCSTGTGTLTIGAPGINATTLPTGLLKNSGAGVLNVTYAQTADQANLAAPNNYTYSGSTTVKAAVLQLSMDGTSPGAASCLGAVPSSFVANNIILDHNSNLGALGATRGYLRAGSSLTLHANRGIYLGNTGGYTGAGGCIQAKNGATIQVNGVISGPGAFWAGPAASVAGGLVNLNAVNTYQGGTYCGSGALQTMVNGAIPTGSPLTMGASHTGVNGTFFNMMGTSQTIGPLASTTGFGVATPLTDIPQLQFSGSGTLTIIQTNTTTFNGAIRQNTGAGGNLVLDATSTGTLTLGQANDYSGSTTINGGTLALSGSGALGSSTIITVGRAGTFDVSQRTTALTLGASQALAAGGTGGSSATLATASGKGLTLGATSPLKFTAVDGTTVPLTIAGAGSVTLAAGNPVTVNTTTALAVGSYKLIAKGASGSVAGAVPTSLTITGAGVAANTTTSLSINNGELYLNVLSNLAPVSQMSLAPAAGGQLSLSYSGGSGSQFVLLQTNNIAAPVANWTRVQTNTAASGSFTITPGSDPAQFYRVKSE